jgi:hypothetical protein
VTHTDDLFAFEFTLLDKIAERLPRDPLGLDSRARLQLDEEIQQAALPARMLALLHRPDEAGKTFWDRWEAARWAGLKTDLVVFARALAQTQVRLLEVRRLDADESTVEALDLLDPEAGRLTLRGGLWDKTHRFQGLLAAVISLPHHHYVLGTPEPLPTFGWEASPTWADEFLHQCGAPLDRPERQTWLRAHLSRVQDVVRSLREWQERCRPRRFALAACSRAALPPGEWRRVRELLQNCPEVPPDPNEDPDNPTPLDPGVLAQEFVSLPGSHPLPSGFVLLREAVLEVEPERESFRSALLAWADARLGGPFDWQTPTQPEAIQPTETMLAQVPPGYLVALKSELDGLPASAPFRLRDSPEDSYDQWMAQPLTLLSGRSPSEAALDPQARPRLLHIIRRLIGHFEEEGCPHFLLPLDPLCERLALFELREPPLPESHPMRQVPFPLMGFPDASAQDPDFLLSEEEDEPEEEENILTDGPRDPGEAFPADEAAEDGPEFFDRRDEDPVQAAARHAAACRNLGLCDDGAAEPTEVPELSSAEIVRRVQENMPAQSNPTRILEEFTALVSLLDHLTFRHSGPVSGLHVSISLLLAGACRPEDPLPILQTGRFLRYAREESLHLLRLFEEMQSEMEQGSSNEIINPAHRLHCRHNRNLLHFAVFGGMEWLESQAPDAEDKMAFLSNLHLVCGLLRELGHHLQA